MNTIKDFVNNINKGTFGIQMVSVTEPKMNKRNNPYYGRVQKITYMLNVMLGYNYENVVNNQLAREGKVANFVADAPKGREWDMFPYILKSTSDSEQMYLRTTMGKVTKVKSIYIIDGKIASDNEVIAIKSFMPKSNGNTNQGTDVEIVVRDFKLENIVLLKQGNKEYNKGGISVDVLKKLFE